MFIERWSRTFWMAITVAYLLLWQNKDLADASKTEDRLLKYLFAEYNPAARPVLHDEDAVNVTFSMVLNQIVEVQTKSQTLVMSVFITQAWKNEILTWDPKKFNNIKSINVDPLKVWRPDVVLYNNADEDKTFGGNLDRLNTRITLSYDGTNKWLAPIIFRSQCGIDVTYFPFDTQRCPLKFGSWTYNLARLDIRSSDRADLSKYVSNAEWKLVSAEAKYHQIRYPCCVEKFPDVTYTIVLARRSLFYLCNLIFPMTVIGMLTILSFLLPAESGERISLAITLLLAMTVFMLVVADIIPATSDVIPLVGIYFSASMIEMVIMIIVLCYIMRLHHKGPTDPPMPLWMRRYIYDWLSYKVFIRKINEDEEGHEQHGGAHNEIKRESEALLNNETMRVFNRLRNTERLCNGNGPPSYTSSTQTPNKSPFAVQPTQAEIILRKLEILVDKLQSMDQEDEIKAEWRTVAMTFDRCLLFFFILIYVITLFACFMKSPGYVG